MPSIHAVHRLSAGEVSEVVAACNLALTRADRSIILDFREVAAVFPDACVPMAAVIQHYKSIGLEVTITNECLMLQRTSFRNPVLATKNQLTAESSVLNTLWAFNDSVQAGQLSRAIITELQHCVVCSDGVVVALDWCLMETLDNVFQHSEAESGYAMAQFHPSQKNFVLCCADVGIGMYKSFANSSYRPVDSADAITLAVREGVTSKGTKNAGNGLFGLIETVKMNGGQLQIRSGAGQLSYQNDSVDVYRYKPKLIDTSHTGTVIDFRLNVSKPVDIARALGVEVLNWPLEQLENDSGEHVVKIADLAHGTGSREVAEGLRTFLENLLVQTSSIIEMNFEGVGVVSSSFADEVLAKLVVKFGFSSFHQRLRLTNMNTTVTAIVDRAIAQRLQRGGAQES